MAPSSFLPPFRGGNGGAEDGRLGDRAPCSPLPGREGLGVGAAEALGGSCEDRFSGADRVFSHIAVPYAEDGPAFASEPFVSGYVAL